LVEWAKAQKVAKCRSTLAKWRRALSSQMEMPDISQNHTTDTLSNSNKSKKAGCESRGQTTNTNLFPVSKS